MDAPFRLDVVEHPGYLHATGSGARTDANLLRLLEEALVACASRGKSSLLLEIGLTGPSLGMGSIFAAIDARSPEARKLSRVAYVDALSSAPGRTSFAETVALNRGVNVRLFGDVESAKRWLEGA